MIASLLPWGADALVLLGLVILTLVMYGMIRMRDPYMSLHAASKSVLVGIGPILLASAASGDLKILLRAILVLAFLVITTPVASHAVARAIYLGDGREGVAKPATPALEPDQAEVVHSDRGTGTSGGTG